ncbi:hypothetical protein ACHAXT_010544 [Thalassiosira profunda]
MISARKVFVALLVGGSVAAPTALAFKPTSVAVRSKDAVAGVPPGAGLDFTKEEVTVRGGDGEDGEGFQLHKKDVIKVHGVSCLLFAAIMFLESLGVKIPLGAETFLPGFDAGNGTMKFMLRMLCGLWIGMGLLEIELNDSDAIKDIFFKYHAFLAPVTLWTAKENGYEGINGWGGPVMIALFLLGHFVGK